MNTVMYRTPHQDFVIRHCKFSPRITQRLVFAVLPKVIPKVVLPFLPFGQKWNFAMLCIESYYANCAIWVKLEFLSDGYRVLLILPFG